MENKRVAVLGLDSVPPQLLFEKLLPELPNFRRLYNRGMHGVLKSCDPPITVPAWMVMMTGKDPGALGIYGFRHRKGYSYGETYIVNSTTVRDETVWERLGKAGRRCVVVGVPPSYPPKPTPNVKLVSCLLTPGPEKAFTSPAELKAEVSRAAKGEYIFDVKFRTEDRESLKKEIFEMTRRRFDVAEALLSHGKWDFFMLHEIGFDRLHHAFWKFFDASHPKHPGKSQFESIDAEYYRLVDDRLGRLLKLFGEETLTFVVSDHGSKGMSGGFCINQWLEKEGYLKFIRKPDKVVDLEEAKVDWGSTKAWGWGGYYARIFFNVKGREANGVVDVKDLESEKERLAAKILRIPDRDGRSMRNQVLDPLKAFARATGDRPDLMVYLGDLNWRSAGTVGHPSSYLEDNDTGPDDSVHSMEGIFMMFDPGKDFHQRELHGLEIQQVGPTILSLFGSAPRSAEAVKPILEVVEAESR